MQLGSGPARMASTYFRLRGSRAPLSNLPHWHSNTSTSGKVRLGDVDHTSMRGRLGHGPFSGILGFQKPFQALKKVIF